MKLTPFTLLILITTGSIPVFAADSTEHSAKASKHSVLALAHGATSTAKVASAVVATPIIIAGSSALLVGAASVHAGLSLAESSNIHLKPHSKNRIKDNSPLVITETTITADPAPNKAVIIRHKQKVTIHQ